MGYYSIVVWVNIEDQLARIVILIDRMTVIFNNLMGYGSHFIVQVIGDITKKFINTWVIPWQCETRHWFSNLSKIMFKADILSTIIQFPGYIFSKIVIYSACVTKSRCIEDNCFLTYSKS